MRKYDSVNKNKNYDDLNYQSENLSKLSGFLVTYFS